MPRKKKTTPLTKSTVHQALDIIKRRAYWREVGEAMLLGIYKPEGFHSLRDRAQPHKGEPGEPVTLGEVLARLPEEYAQKVMGLDASWLIALLAPSLEEASAFDWRRRQDENFRPQIELVLRPDASERVAAAVRELAPMAVEVEPPRILALASSKTKKKATAKKAAPKKATAKKATAKKATAKKATAKKAAPKKATAKKATAKKATAKKATKGTAQRRSMEDLKVLMRVLLMKHEAGLTRAEVRESLSISGVQVKKLLESEMLTGKLVLAGEGRKARYRYLATTQSDIPGTAAANEPDLGAAE